ncbi:MAG: hypothetical protein QXK18_08245, partial [Candidatus Bathyarchaeia archaeon]
AKLGVPKSTLQRWYAKRLERRIEERRKTLADLEQKISKLQMEFNTLKNKYEQKHRVLTEEYRARKAKLEGEIERLKRDSEAIRAAFERQGISWNEGLAIVANTSSLRNEQEKLKGEISKLKMEASSCQNMLNQVKLNIQRLQEDELKLKKAVSTMRATYRSYTNWFKTEAPKLEQCKSQLQQSIKALENQKLKITKEIAELQQVKAQSQSSLKALEAEKAKAVEEIAKLKREVEGLTKRIIADTEEKRAKILRETERLEKDVEKLRAEKELLEQAVKQSLKQLQHSRNNQKADALSQAHKSSESPVETLLKRVPTVTPPYKKQTRKIG